MSLEPLRAVKRVFLLDALTAVGGVRVFDGVVVHPDGAVEFDLEAGTEAGEH